MFCEKCGGKIPDGARFCEKCGTPVEDNSAGVSDKSYMKWIVGGIGGGISLVVIILAVLFATGVLGGRKESTQVSTKPPSDIGVSETAIPSAEPTVIPTIEPTITAEPTEPPVENDGGDENGTQVSDDMPEDNSGKNNGYIFPDSDSEYLTKSDVKNLSARKINLAKNELYARHGRKFDREDLQEYFEKCNWYTPLYTAKEWDNYGDSYFFNEYEIKNRNLLKKWENKKKK
ncbi:MAG: YARHG domain-containing protein [Ruminococcus flavefaciens]|nr:YARHG domain-containing protein [Ruminococcus flavefaciens]